MINLDLIRELGGEIYGNINPEDIKDVHNTYQEICPGSMFIAIKGSKHDGAEFVHEAIKRGAVAVITSRKLDIIIPQIVVDNVLIFISRYAMKARQLFKNSVIAITGSVGKTTLRHVLSLVLPGKKLYTRKSFNNKFPITMLFLLLDNSYDYVIIETGTNFIGEIEDIARLVKPDYTLMNKICYEHTEFLKNIETVILEEYSILDYTKNYVISENSNELLLKNHNISKILDNSKNIFVPTFVVNDDLLKIDNISIELCSNEYGLLNAISIVVFFLRNFLNIDTEYIQQQMKKIHSISHRGNKINIKDIILYDYSFNMNPTSFNNLISNIQKKCILFFSKMRELGDITESENYNMMKNIYDHKLIEKAFLVDNDYDIPSEFNDKIYNYHEDVLNNLNQKVLYFQGARSMQLENIIYKIIDKSY